MSITEKIREAITGFHWWNFGLDNVSETESTEWAEALAEEIATAIGQGERITTRKPTDLWQAVLHDSRGNVWTIDEAAASYSRGAGFDFDLRISIVRRTAALVVYNDTAQMAVPYDPADLIRLDEVYNAIVVLAERYAQAQAMARGLNAAATS